MTRIPSRAPIFCVAIVLLYAWLATVSGELLVETEPQLTDSGGRPAPRLSLALAALAPGQVIAIAPYPRRFDSCYFGSISTSQVVAFGPSVGDVVEVQMARTEHSLEQGQRVAATKRAFAARSWSW